VAPQHLRRPFHQQPVYQPPPAGGQQRDQSSFWDSYKVPIVVVGGLAIAAGVYFYMKKQQEGAELAAKRDRVRWRLRAEQYAEERASQLARAQLDRSMQAAGRRHDIGDPGIRSDMASSHDFETNVDQRPSPGGTAVTSHIQQQAAPHHPSHPHASLSDDDSFADAQSPHDDDSLPQ